MLQVNSSAFASGTWKAIIAIDAIAIDVINERILCIALSPESPRYALAETLLHASFRIH
jgi:hypothetical protein